MMKRNVDISDEVWTHVKMRALQEKKLVGVVLNDVLTAGLKKNEPKTEIEALRLSPELEKDFIARCKKHGKQPQESLDYVAGVWMARMMKGEENNG